MDLNPPEFWMCSACTYPNNPWGLVECFMCGVAVRKETKHPLEDAAPPATASKLKKKKSRPQRLSHVPPKILLPAHTRLVSL